MVRRIWIFGLLVLGFLFNPGEEKGTGYFSDAPPSHGCLRFELVEATHVLMSQTRLQIELEQEEDGRWIAEVTDIPGVMAYGTTREEAIAAVQAIALLVLVYKNWGQA